MIQRIIVAAALLLVLQLAVTFFICTQRTSALKVSAPAAPFVSLQAENITALQLRTGAGETLFLEKTEQGWTLPGLFSAPADARQVEYVLNRLSQMQQGFAIASTKEAAQRFKTAENQFERHLLIKEGSTVRADVYLGTASDFRHSYGRRAGEEEIYTLALRSMDLAVEGEHWLDKQLAAVDIEQIQGIGIKESSWLPAGEEASESARTQLLKLLSRLHIETVWDPATAAPFFQQQPLLHLLLEDQRGATTDYIFVQGEARQYLLSTGTWYCTVPFWQMEALMTALQHEEAIEEEREDIADD
jgi:hypothetical protein